MSYYYGGPPQPIFVDPVVAAAAAAEEERRKKRNTLIAIAIVLFIILLVVGGVLLALYLSKEDASESSTTSRGGRTGRTGGSRPGVGTSSAAAGRGTKPILPPGGEQHCVDSQCTQCEAGYGPDDVILERIRAEGLLSESEIPKRCSVPRDWFYRQTLKPYAKFTDESAQSICEAEFGSDAKAVNTSSSYILGSGSDAVTIDSPYHKGRIAGADDDEPMQWEQFNRAMTERGPSTDLPANTQYLTCRWLNVTPAPLVCVDKDRKNFDYIDCASKCKEGYGPEPPAKDACMIKYEPGYEYFFTPCLSADSKVPPCVAPRQFVEFVPGLGASTATGDDLSTKGRPYAKLYEAINAGKMVTNCPPMRLGDAPMQGAICRKPAQIVPDDRETTEQEKLRLSMPFQNKLAGPAAKEAERKTEEAKTVEGAFNANEEAYVSQLKTSLQARVLIDVTTGESKGGYHAAMLPLYEQKFPTTPLPSLATEAQKVFDALGRDARNRVVSDFVGPQGSFNTEQAKAVCAKRKLLADFRSAVEAHLAKNYNEFAEWPPKTIPKVNVSKYDSAKGEFTSTLVCE